VERQIIGNLPNAPFNALFDLLDTHDLPIEWQDFSFERESVIDEFFNNEENGDVVENTEVNCLRPVLKYVANVGDEPTILQECWECTKIKEDVEEEFCGGRGGPCCSMGPVCRKCSGYSTCSSCGRKACPCVFVDCCVQDCSNEMCACAFFGSSETLPYGNALGCGFVLFPPDDVFDSDAYWDAELGYAQYCGEHKPDGAVPFTGEYHPWGW
jgi:hypothetical protein